MNVNLWSNEELDDLRYLCIMYGEKTGIAQFCEKHKNRSENACRIKIGRLKASDNWDINLIADPVYEPNKKECVLVRFFNWLKSLFC